jgi:hypothetical protein
MFYAGEGPIMRAFQIFDLLRPIISNLEGHYRGTFSYTHRFLE